MPTFIKTFLLGAFLALSALPLNTGEPPPPDGIFQAIRIRAISSRQVKELRDMRLDIVKVVPDTENPPSRKNPSGGFIVDAVVTPSMAVKLQRMGYSVIGIREK